MSKEYIEIKVKMKRYKTLAIILSAIYIAAFCLITYMSCNLIYQGIVIEGVFVLFSIFYFKFLFQKIKFMQPYANLIHIIPSVFFVWCKCEVLMRGAYLGMPIFDYYKFFSLSFIIAIIGSALAFIFDFIYKKLIKGKSEKAALKLN